MPTPDTLLQLSPHTERQFSPENAIKPLRRKHRLLAFICWLNLLFICGLWIAIRLGADRWWPATLIAFGPRWIYAAPLIPLIPTALALRRKSLGVLFIATLIALFPIMDLRLTWRNAISPAASGPSLRVITCNTHNNALDVSALEDLIGHTNPDIVTLQEWNGSALSVFNNGKWQYRRDGEFFFASKHSFRKSVDVTLPGYFWPATSYEVQLPSGSIRVFNVHLASPHAAFRAALHHQPNGIPAVEQNSLSRRDGARALGEKQADIKEPLLLCGDFNLPIDSAIYRDHLSTLTDAFSQAGTGFGWTYHAPFTLTRIDHILCNRDWNCRQCWVGPNIGSPHRPLIADLNLVAPSR